MFKTRFISMLVLLAAVATGAMAQTTYKVSVKEGTEDATNWQGKAGEGAYQSLPLEGVAAGTAVSVKYNGTKHVKSVKAKKPDLLSGVFSVSASKKVKFSKGNLRYASGTWSFFNNQYDYYTSYSAGAWDKFGWSTSATTYGMNTSTDNATYSGDFVDWGATMGTGWFTLSSDEWTYLLNTRTSGGTVFGTSSARYAHATINTDGTGVNGMILFPDGVDIASTEVTTAGTVNNTSAYATTCTTAQWSALAAKGCVFLPAAGFRGQASVNGAGSYGYYWSSSPYTSDAYRAYLAFFYSGTLNPASYSNRNVGYSVRLVQATSDAAPATPALSITSPSVGQVIGSDGKNYAAASVPSGVTKVAMIAYVSGSNGLAIALADEGSLIWETAKSTCEAKTPAFTNGTWKLPTLDEWKQMFIANGGSEYSQSDLNTALAAAGGDNSKLKEGRYWTLTEEGEDAWNLEVGDGDVYWGSHSKGESYPVRACLAFTVEQGGAAYTLLSAATAEDVGKVVCAAGHLHDAKTAVPAGCTAVGILGKVTTTGHGLILALKDATKQMWNTIDGWESVTYAGTTLKLLPNNAARGANLTSYTMLGETAVSDWAVAQKSDYEAIFTNLGSTTVNSDGTTYDGNVNAYITTGVGGTAISGPDNYYWSATEFNRDRAWHFGSDHWFSNFKLLPDSVRPVLGF